MDGAYEKVRGVIASVYDRDYRTLEDLYGEVNDDDDFVPDGVERVESPFQQFDPKRNTRPSSIPFETPQDENGFAGLDAPLN